MRVRNRLPIYIVVLFVLPALLCFAACGKKTAASVSLRKTEGAVDIADNKGKAVTPAEGLKLYGGYSAATRPLSYAWIDLDAVKLAKMDEDSEVDIQKAGKELELKVRSGSLFFHVAEPLEEDEAMDIHTSTMLVGIRGTRGWVEAVSETRARVYILEGTVAVMGADGKGQASVSAGEMAEALLGENGEVAVTVEPFSGEDVPAFVREELGEDEILPGETLESSGQDAPDTPVSEDTAKEAYERVLAEYRELSGLDLRNNPGAREQIDWGAYQYVDERLAWFLGDDLGYAYYDLNGDGTEELFVESGRRGSSSYSWNALYSFDGTDAVNLAVQHGYYKILADGLLLHYDDLGYVYEVSRVSEGGASLEPVSDSGLVLYRQEDGSTWGASMVFNQDLPAHGGEVDDLLEWSPLNGEGGQPVEYNMATYTAGDFACAENGVQFNIEERSGEPYMPRNTRYYLNTPRPGDPSHLDVLYLTAIDGAFWVMEQETERCALVLIPQDGGLLVESTGVYGNLDYLEGHYRLE